MSSFSILMRLQIRNRLAILRGGGLRGTDGKLKTGKLVGGVFILLAYLMILGMVVGFEFLLFEGLKAIGQPELLLSMALTVVMAGMVFMSFFYVLTSLYYGRDTAFLASLPVTSRTVFGTKLTEILLGETGIAALALLPAIILYGIYTQSGVGYYISALLVALTSAMIPVAVVTLLATLIVRLTGGSRHRDAVMMIYSLLIMVVVLTVEFSVMGRTPEDAGMMYFVQLMLDKQLLMRQLAQAFPPSWWAMQGLMGNAWSLLGYLLCAVGAYGAVWLLMGGGYLTRTLSLTENTVRHKARKRGEIRPHRPLTTLFLREWREILRTPVYAYNCLTGCIIMPLMLVGMYFGGKEAAEVDNLGMMLSVVQGALSQVSQVYLFLGLVALMTFICCMNPAVDTAVSREGGRHMLSRMLPVSTRTQLQAKLLMGMTINLISAIVGAVMFICLLPAFTPVILLALLFTQVTNWGLSSYSLALDAARPKFHWRNEMQAIKQNGNIALGMLISFLLLVIPVAVFFLLGELTLNARAAVVIGICIVESVIGYAILMRVADTTYARMEDEGA